jgi:hypothetical protein
MRFIRQILLVALWPIIFVPQSWAQFSSGSTGSDGAYSPTVSGDFDPIALGLDPSGDNVFNFTTINIPAGVTIKLRASKLRNAAVTWLATGNVTITGTLDLSGASVVPLITSQTASLRAPTEPGPGGYSGGLGSLDGVGPQSGAGPGGGPAGLQTAGYGCYGGSGSFISLGYTSEGILTGPTYGSYLLVPLYGGSGGGGGWDNASGSNVGGIGGAGGGALRIASTTQISMGGTINANGGQYGTVSGSNAGCPGGAGAGGAIHLIAPTILGSGSMTAISGTSGFGGTIATGIVRFSTTTNSFTGTASPALVQSALYLPPPNSTLTLPSLIITQVNGVSVPAAAAGSYVHPDVVISAAGAVTVNLTAANIPLGTIVRLLITSETAADVTVSCTALAGTAAASTATCSATFPFPISIADVRASW